MAKGNSCVNACTTSLSAVPAAKQRQMRSATLSSLSSLSSIPEVETGDLSSICSQLALDVHPKRDVYTAATSCIQDPRTREDFWLFHSNSRFLRPKKHPRDDIFVRLRRKRTNTSVGCTVGIQRLNQSVLAAKLVTHSVAVAKTALANSVCTFVFTEHGIWQRLTERYHSRAWQWWSHTITIRIQRYCSILLTTTATNW